MTSDPKIMLYKATNFKITGDTGPTGIFGGNRDTKIRSSGNHLLYVDLALMFIE